MPRIPTDATPPAARRPKQRGRMSGRTVSFTTDNPENIQGFLETAQSFGMANQRLNFSDISLSEYESIAFQHGMTPMDRGDSHWLRSKQGEELHRFRYQRRIFTQDLKYLDWRDPTTIFLTRHVPKHTWSRPPTTNHDRIDEFFRRIHNLGFYHKAAGADRQGRIHGAGILVIGAPGPLMEPLEPGDKNWVGFDWLNPEFIDWDKTQPSDGTDPLIDHRLGHGINTLVVENDEGKRGEIHGHRFVVVSDDISKHTVPKKRPVVLEGAYDSIWNLRRHVFSATQAYKVPPVVLSLDLENGIRDIDDDKAAKIASEARMVQDGALDVVGPNKGVLVERMDNARMPDPEWGIRLLAGELEKVTELTNNMVVPFSRGSQQVTDEDVDEFQTNIDERRRYVARPVYVELIERAKFTGMIPRKRGVEMPMEVEWPTIQTPTLRNMALVWRNFARTAAEAAQTQRAPPPIVDRTLPKDDSIEPPFSEQGFDDEGEEFE